MKCPYSPRRRRSLHSNSMGGNSDDSSHSPSSSQGLECAKEGGSKLPHTGSKDDDNNKNSSGTGVSRSTENLQHTKEKTKSTEILKQLLKHWMCIFVLLSCITACVILYLIQGYMRSHTTQDTAEVNETFLREAIKRIREDFPSQLKHIWAEFSAGINATAQGTPTKPSVFMLLYETEEGTAICLAQKVGNMSTHLLDARKSNPLLIIDGADLEHNETLAEDYGTLLEEYRPKVEEQRAMIINNLHKIPGTVAQSFHSFCDTVTPAVGKAVYLFTMKASGVSDRDNPNEVAEEELRKLWSDELDEDRLNPLIARITDMTMMIKPEKNLVPC